MKLFLKHVVAISLLSVFSLSRIYADEGETASVLPIKVSQNKVRVKIETGMFFGMFKKNTGEIEIEIPIQNAYGFEGMPVTTENKETVNSIDYYLKNNIAEIIQFQDLICVYNVDSLEKEYHDIGTLKVRYDITCDESIRKHEVRTDFSAFKDIMEIHLRLEGAEEIKMIVDGNHAEAVLH